MKTLLWTLSIGSLAGGIAAVMLLVSLLRSMPGGPFIGGAGVMLALLAGAVLIVLVATGLGTGYALRRHGHAGPLHVHLVFAGALLVAAAGFGLSLAARKAETQRQVQAAMERSEQEARALEALLSDPARLAAHVAQHGVHGAIPGTWMSPLEAAATRGHTALALQLLDQGATVTEHARAVAAQRGDTALLDAMRARRAGGGAAAGAASPRP